MAKLALPCLLCGRILENADQSTGLLNSIPMDGSRLEINICDPCLKRARTTNRVHEEEFS